MEFDTKDIKAKSKENFQKTWLETAKLLPKGHKDYSGGKGKQHYISELIQESRKIFLELGFDEIENQIFIPEEDVYKQYGPEAPVILDRCYYLAGLPRPDIGISQDKIAEIKKIKSDLNLEELQKIFREYKEGSVEGDDLFENMVNRLKLKTEDAAKILDLFPEFRNIEAISSKMTLRSHMTAAWFPTLQALQYIHKMPLKLFSLGLRFRREQRVDASHLRAHYGGSCVIMDRDISLESGKKITEEVLSKLGFSNFKFAQKKATSNYYAPETELEVYSGNIEIADIGMYSPIALANYDITYPVFNLGFGLERVLMARRGIKDVRELLYPQFYGKLELSDQEIVTHISIEKVPKTEDGLKLVNLIGNVAQKNADEKSPCRFNVYEGKFMGQKIEVNLIEKEANTKLLGPAAMNEIYVLKGGIYAIPKETFSKSFIKTSDQTFLKSLKDSGIKLDFTVLDAISNYFAYEIENALNKGEKSGFIQIKMAKGPNDVNITVSDLARRFILSKNKQISIKGPIFTAVEFTVI